MLKLKLKLCFNGVHLENPFSLHLKLNQLLLYSTSSAIKSPNYTPIMDYLVKSLGFSREEAVTTSKKVSPSKLKSSKKYDLVVDFFKQCGFKNTQIKKIVSSNPDMLWLDVEKTLEPKFSTLQQLGIKGSDLTRVVTSNPLIIKRDLSTQIVPMITYLKSILDSTSDLLTVLGRSYWLIYVNVDKVFRPNMELLRNYGLSNEKIRKLLLFDTSIFRNVPKNLEKIMIKVEDELGIPRNSPMFTNGIYMLGSMSEKTRQVKCQLFKSFGWTESDLSTMLRKLPRCLLLSETKIHHRLEFFMSELGCDPAYIASHPYILTYSIEARVVPRFNFLRILKERGLIKDIPSVTSAICLSEPLFLKHFVLPYNVELPELCKAYICRKKAHPWLEDAPQKVQLHVEYICRKTAHPQLEDAC